MNIIIDNDQVESYQQKYTVLELDTIRIMPEGREVTAYCVVEKIPMNDLSKVEVKQNLHQSLMDAYKRQDWEFCTQALEGLRGFWSGELDSFYDEIYGRIQRFQSNNPGDSWDPVIEKLIQS